MARSKSLLPVWVTVPGAILLLVGGCILLLPTMSTPRSHTRQVQSLNNLRNIAIAGQAYATAFEGRIPAGGSIDDALPEWSWQTHLLPYLEQDALYRRIDFTRPWTSRENRELLSMDLRIFQSPNASDRSPVDGYGVTHYAANSRVFRPSEGVSLDEASMKDGTTSTIMIGGDRIEVPSLGSAREHSRSRTRTGGRTGPVRERPGNAVRVHVPRRQRTTPEP